MSRAEANSASTVASISEPVTTPASALPAPAETAYISASARRPLMSRARGAGRPDCLLCPGCRVWVIVLIYVTVGAKWSTDKVQFDGYSVVRFGAGVAAPARPR